MEAWPVRLISGKGAFTLMAVGMLTLGLVAPVKATSVDPAAVPVPTIAASAAQDISAADVLNGVGGQDAATSAAVDMFLKIDGIEGESTDERHKGEIEIESFSWGATQTGSHASGGGGGAGKVSMQDFHFTTAVSKASPKLFLACASGQHIKSATLTLRKAGKDQQEYIVIKFTDLLVSSYQSGGSGGVVPTDQVSLNFAKIEFSYREQRPDGTLAEPITTGWDLKANREP